VVHLEHDGEEAGLARLATCPPSPLRRGMALETRVVASGLVALPPACWALGLWWGDGGGLSAFFATQVLSNSIIHRYLSGISPMPAVPAAGYMAVNK
jgi:hypothetical protein